MRISQLKEKEMEMLECKARIFSENQYAFVHQGLNRPALLSRSVEPRRGSGASDVMEGARG